MKEPHELTRKTLLALRNQAGCWNATRVVLTPTSLQVQEVRERLNLVRVTTPSQRYESQRAPRAEVYVVERVKCSYWVDPSYVGGSSECSNHFTEK
jgi:hypothetical protein